VGRRRKSRDLRCRVSGITRGRHRR